MDGYEALWDYDSNNSTEMLLSKSAESSHLSVFAIAFIVVASVVAVIAVVGIGIIVKERKKAAASTSTPTMIPLQELPSSSTTTPRFNYALFDETVAEHVTPKRPTAAKRPRIEQVNYADLIKDLYLVLQEENREITLIDVTDKDAFANSDLTIIQRANLNVGDETYFINTDDNPVSGSVMFVGKRSECDEFLKGFNQPDQNQENSEAFNHQDTQQQFGGALDELNARMDSLATKVDENAAGILLLKQRMSTLEAKKPPATATVRPKPTSALQTMYNGVSTKISDIPNWPNYLRQRLLHYQATSNPLMVNNTDIRPQLYLNQNFFITNYNKPNDVGLALLYILIGSNLANSSFLPLVFYDIGPSSRSGTPKTAMSYTATSIWYQSLDLLLTNVFIASHRHLYIVKARTFINQNVNTLNKYPDRNRKTFKNLVLQQPIFSAADAVVQNFAEEKDRIRGTEEAQEVINWANGLGLDEEPEAEEEFE